MINSTVSDLVTQSIWSTPMSTAITKQYTEGIDKGTTMDNCEFYAITQD